MVRMAKGAMIILWLVALCLATGCYVSNYPVITDDRGDYSGVIRTGHKAFVYHQDNTQIASVYPDGSDETFSMIYQNAYGDQKIYTFNNFDPTASVIFLDQTYCDWRYEGCAVATAWNPARGPDDPFDMTYDFDCSGARSICMMVSYGSRNGECGDHLWQDGQNLAAEFADLATTTFRGAPAYVVPINASNSSLMLTGEDGITGMLPLYGNFDGIITEDLKTVFSATPNTKLELRWLREWVGAHGARTELEFSYGSISGTIPVAFREEGLAYNATRF